MGGQSRIDLLIPGLFGPVPLLGEDLPDLPSLSGFLDRADCEPATGSEPIAVLFDRFGVQPDPDLDPPSAPFSRLADSPGASTAGYWLHADPIHLRPDRDGLLLFDARHIGLEREEVDSLSEIFNEHFAAEGLRLETPAIDRWYLHADSPPRLRTHQLAEMVGRRVDRSYLGGEDAARWMGWLNEVQMLFHQAAVNRQREIAGKPGVSGIWPWGGGALPAAIPQCSYDSVYTRDPLTLGLATVAGTAAYPLPEPPQTLFAGELQGRTLVYWDALWPAVLDGDTRSWIEALLGLAAWLDALAGRLKRGEVGRVALYPCNGTCLLATRRSFRRFWRRSKSFAARLQGT